MTQRLIVLLAILTGLAALTASAQQQHLVVQKNRAFEPTRLTVKAGETILFRNDDKVAHNVFSTTKGSEFDLRIQRPGSTSPMKLLKAGAVEIRCAIHPGMKLLVTVKR